MLIASIVMLVQGDGHWSFVAFAATVLWVGVMGVVDHAKVLRETEARIDTLKAQHHMELLDFGTHLTRTKDRMNISPTTSADVQRWRQLRRK
jgi:hypothetical protein